MRLITNKCETDGCFNNVNIQSYWNMCIDCFMRIPSYIPVVQANDYVEKKNKCGTLKRGMLDEINGNM